MEKITFAVFPTLFGWMGVIASQKGIRRLNLPVASKEIALQDLGPEISGGIWDPSSFEKLRLKIEKYFLGEKVRFDETLDLRNDAKFFQNAWKSCKKARLDALIAFSMDRRQMELFLMGKQPKY